MSRNLSSMIRKLLQKIPSHLEGEKCIRNEKCSICNSHQAEIISLIDFWDIKSSRIVRCDKCHHIQLDPMLTEEETSKGCNAYFMEESLRTEPREQIRNHIRNFRRGVLFAYSLKRKKNVPQNILELGPGSGYFSAGIQFVIPESKLTVMDINPDVLSINASQHGYSTLLEVPDRFVDACQGRFDLVIARDLLEHVSDITKVIGNINKYLVPGGYFHFITPNGQEDVWKHYLTWKHMKHKSELLINHVNYFDGRGLKELLINSGFQPVSYFTYGIKATVKGAGWKKSKKLYSCVSEQKSASQFLNRKLAEDKVVEPKKNEILNQWYICNKAKWIVYLYSFYQHQPILKIPPEANVGHEIFGLFQKT